MNFKAFNFSSLEQVKQECSRLGVNLCFSENLDIFKKKVEVEGFIAPNSIAIHPMEGSDGELDGSPGELTKRRYERFLKSGAGLVWFEAVAVVPEGRASARQLWINEDNLPAYQALFENMMKTAQAEYGKDFKPLCIMQLTHSGRFSKPSGAPEPILGCHDPYLDAKFKVAPDRSLISDDELEKLEDKFVEAAVLAKKAGFHGVDVKGCHRYLNSELLSAFTRKGRYGGSFEGRTRFMLNTVEKIRQELGSGFIVTTRMNIYDGIPYPYGWGVDREDIKKTDLSEPLMLIKMLHDKGMRLINLTMGTPYYNPHVNRPYDRGAYIPDEEQLEGVARLANGIGRVQQEFPDMAVVGTGYSWLRQFSQNLAAGSLENGLAKFIGYGRVAFAYPDFPRDILFDGGLKKEKCCITCAKCSDILRMGGAAGCVIRDSGVYAPIYSEFCEKV